MDISIILSSCIVAFTTIASIFVKEYLQNKKNEKKNCIIEYTRQNENVEKALEYTLDELNADRVYIFEFHNGEHFYSGNHQQKFSATYESVAAGISSESLNLQNLRVSTFNHFIKDIIDYKMHIFNSDYKNKKSLCYNWFKQRGIHNSYAFPVKTLNKKIIGIICIDFNKNQKKLTSENIKFIKNQSNIISGYLI